jgi:hypothetical protein
MSQLSLLEEQITWIEVTKLPSINWLYQYATMLHGEFRGMTDRQLLKSWKAASIANYSIRTGNYPKMKSNELHLLHQAGSGDLVLLSEEEMKRRGLDIDLQ